jgi:hypothetical protein
MDAGRTASRTAGHTASRTASRTADLNGFRERTLSRGVNPLLYWTARAVLVPFLLIYFRMGRIGREHLPRNGPLLLAAGVTRRVWACVSLQWEWLGGADGRPALGGGEAGRQAAQSRARRQGLAARERQALQPAEAQGSEALKPARAVRAA